MSIEKAVAHMRSSWSSKERTTILFQNLHTMFLQIADHRYLACYDDALSLIDGTPLVHLLRRAGHDVGDDDRASAIDLIHPVLGAAVADNKRVFVIGQQEHILHRALTTLRARHHGLKISGHHGYFDTDGGDAEHVFAAANNFEADLVLVGLGSPLSELWIHENRSCFDASIVWVCGALMEYVAGHVPTPPRWSGPMGIEWVFRFANDPKRFLTRYFYEPFWLGVNILGRRLRP